MHTARSFFFQAEAGIRDYKVTGVQTCALPISDNRTPLEPTSVSSPNSIPLTSCSITAMWRASASSRSEEHTSELQSPCNLVCRLLLEKKKKISVKIALA